MTAQAPERIILDGRPRQLFADPLYRLSKHFRLELGNPYGYSTSNHRSYIGTWEIRHGSLYLTHLSWEDLACERDGLEQPVSDEVRDKLLRAASSSTFPIYAHWFNGILKIALGKRLVYSHHGWSSWYERERIIHLRGGKVVRDREVDTRAMLERRLRRDAGLARILNRGESSHEPRDIGPLTWFDDDEMDWVENWWPPNYSPHA